MGTALSLAGSPISPISDAGTETVAAATYYAIDPIGKPPAEGDPEYEEMPVSFAGVDGVGTKGLGFRGRDIYVEVLFVATSKANARTAKNSLITTMRNARFSVTVPGSTARPSCRMVPGGFVDLKEMTLNGKHVLHCGLKIRQMGTS